MKESAHTIVIGAMKSGTTSVHEVLSRHPEISVSKFKEPNFFNTNFSRGMDWYRSQFRNDVLFTLDVSPNYAKGHQTPDTAARMHSLFPAAKLIYIVRDPLDRIVSHLHHDIHRDRLSPREAATAVLENDDYILTSSYYYQLSFFLKFYSNKTILILPFELLRDSPQVFFDRICAFMGLSPMAAGEKNRFYASDSKYLIKGFDSAKKYLPGTLRQLYHRAFQVLAIRYDKPVLAVSAQRKIKERLCEDIAKLSEFCNYDFPEWRTYHEIIIA